MLNYRCDIHFACDYAIEQLLRRMGKWHYQQFFDGNDS